MNLIGSTIWARKTTVSDIFLKKPDKWFKIWFFIITNVNWKDSPLFPRGTNFFTYAQIESSTGATKEQIYKCLKWLTERREGDAMATTRKTTRGIIITVLNFAKYQDSIKKKDDAPDDGETTQRRHYKRNNKEENKQPPPSGDDGFQEFWELYPRKVSKKEALKAWKKLQPSLEVRVRIQEAVSAALTSPQWTKDDGRFIPHPATWLNQERWEDEETRKAEPRQIDAEHNQRLKELGYES